MSGWLLLNNSHSETSCEGSCEPRQLKENRIQWSSMLCHTAAVAACMHALINPHYNTTYV